jgi:AmmeMemoRadiSam system protein B
MEKPRLRPFLAALPDDQYPGHVLVWDQLAIGDGPQRFSRTEFVCLQLFNGEHDLHAVCEQARQRAAGPPVSVTFLETLVGKLDEAAFLDGPRFRQQVEGPVREPRCIGCYPGDPDDLRDYLYELFTAQRGAGLPQETKPQDRLRAVLLPHIDYPRGGACYTWACKEIAEQTDASLFVIIGTSHYSMHRFTLTRKHFKTPLGITVTDQDYIDRLVCHYGPGLFDDEWLAHLPEHSIELEVVFLQYLFENRRPIRIVPLVVGSFFDCVNSRSQPSHCQDIRHMIDALRRVEKELTEPICYLISGDLAHIGPKFGDRRLAISPWLEESRQRDHVILRQLAAASADGYFDAVAEEADARRICGLPPTYLTLQAARPTWGKVLDYDQYNHPRGLESVSFASMAFYA